MTNSKLHSPAGAVGKAVGLGAGACGGCWVIRARALRKEAQEHSMVHPATRGCQGPLICQCRSWPPWPLGHEQSMFVVYKPAVMAFCSCRVTRLDQPPATHLSSPLLWVHGEGQPSQMLPFRKVGEEAHRLHESAEALGPSSTVAEAPVPSSPDLCHLSSLGPYSGGGDSCATGAM